MFFCIDATPKKLQHSNSKNILEPNNKDFYSKRLMMKRRKNLRSKSHLRSKSTKSSNLEILKRSRNQFPIKCFEWKKTFGDFFSETN